MYAAKKLLKSIGIGKLEGPPDRAFYDVSNLAAVDFILYHRRYRGSGCDSAGLDQPRWEASLVNNAESARAVRQGKCEVFGIGRKADQTYPVEMAGDDMGPAGETAHAVKGCAGTGRKARRSFLAAAD